MFSCDWETWRPLPMRLIRWLFEEPPFISLLFTSTWPFACKFPFFCRYWKAFEPAFCEIF